MATAPTAEQEAEELPISVSNRKREEGDLDITPMIDITFLLLIFFPGIVEDGSRCGCRFTTRREWDGSRQ